MIVAFISISIIAFFAGKIQEKYSNRKVAYLNIYKRGELYYSKTLWETKREADFESSGEPDFVKMIEVEL